MSKFVLPIGIDSENLFNPLNSSIETLEKLQQSSKDTGKALNDAFNQGGNAIDKIEDKLKPVQKNLEAIKLMGKQMGKELADAFSQRNIDPSKLEKSVENFKRKLASIQKVSIEIDADPAKLAVYERQLEQTTNAAEMLKIAIAATDDVMSRLDPNSPEYQQAAENIAFLEQTMATYADEVEQTTGAQKSLKAQLREMKAELSKMEMAGKAGSKAYNELRIKAGELEDQLGDTNAQVKILASDTKIFDGLISGATGVVGAFTAVQGAAALWGGENEELEKTLMKVNGAMAVLQGLQAVAEVLNKDSAFSVVFLSKARQADVVATEAQTAATAAQTVAMNGANVATKLLRIGLASIGIGLIIALVAYLIANWDKLKASMEKILPATKDMGKGWDELKAIFVGVGTALVEYVIAPFKIAFALITEGLDGAIEQAKESYNVIDNYNKGHQQQVEANARAHALEMKKIRMQQWENQLKIEEAEGKDTYKSREKLYKNKIAIAKKEGEDTKDLEQELAEFQARKRGEDRKAAQDAAKKAADEAKKAAEDAKKKREDELKKAAEFAKQQTELTEKYTREINALRIDKLEDGLEKERQKIKNDAENRIADLKKDEAQRADAVTKRNELIQAIEEDAKNKIIALEREKEIELLQLKLNGAEMLANLSKDSLEKDLELARIAHEKTLIDIEQNYKDQADLRIQLVNAENEAYQREQARIALENKQKTNEIEEEKALLTIELAQKYAGKGVEVEEQKQLAILAIKAQYAEKALQVLLDSGKGENDVEVMRARKLVKDTRDAIEDETKKGKKFDMFKFLGLGSLSKEQQEAVVGAASQTLSNLNQIADGIVEQYQRQIDKKQEVIDQYNNEIDELEGKLDEEKQLREDGYANNVELIEKEIADKKAQRDEEIRQQKELQEKQAQIQKAQMAADTAVQLVNMITASTNIFESLSSIPFIGIPLAIATIATMFGAFAVAKVNAFNAIKSGQQFGDGGEISGDKHSAPSGGVQYYSKDGKNIALEDGEFVTKAKSYQKHKKLVRAINADDFSGLSIDDIAALGVFERFGISFLNQSAYDAVDETKEFKTYSSSQNAGFTGSTGSNKHLESIDKNVTYLTNKKKEEVEVYEDETFIYRKRGTRITRKRK